MSLQAAIEWITWVLKLDATERGEVGVSDVEVESFQKTLPVLETAEKVDKKIALEALRELRYLLVDEDERDADFIKQWHLIRALLFALPDKE